VNGNSGKGREREREKKKKKEMREERENERKKRCSRFFYVCMLTFCMCAVIALTPISISQKSVNTHTCTLKRK
jgi:hypothetical protein